MPYCGAGFKRQGLRVLGELGQCDRAGQVGHLVLSVVTEDNPAPKPAFRFPGEYEQPRVFSFAFAANEREFLFCLIPGFAVHLVGLDMDSLLVNPAVELH